MTEKLLHDLFHAVLPTLTAYVNYFLAALAAMVLAWVRQKLQVREVALVVTEVEEEAKRDIALGRGKPAGALKKWRAMRRAGTRMNVLVRPREKRLDKLVEREWKKQKSEAKETRPASSHQSSGSKPGENV